MSNLKTTPRFFAESLGEIMLESKLMLQFGLLQCFGFKKRCSALFGITNDLLATFQENISLIYDSFK